MIIWCSRHSCKEVARCLNQKALMLTSRSSPVAVILLSYIQLICTCINSLLKTGSGITASILYLALERIGARKLAVYDGSWTEYAAKDDALIIKDK